MSLTEELDDVNSVKPFPHNNLEEPKSMEDEIIEGMIKAIEERGWYGHGWNNGPQVCILESANVAKYGKVKSSYRYIPKKVIERVHTAIFGEFDDDEGFRKPTKERLADDIMEWNDGGGAGDQKTVLGVLRKALRKKTTKKGT